MALHWPCIQSHSPGAVADCGNCLPEGRWAIIIPSTLPEGDTFILSHSQPHPSLTPTFRRDSGRGDHAHRPEPAPRGSGPQPLLVNMGEISHSLKSSRLRKIVQTKNTRKKKPIKRTTFRSKMCSSVLFLCICLPVCFSLYVLALIYGQWGPSTLAQESRADNQHGTTEGKDLPKPDTTQSKPDQANEKGIRGSMGPAGSARTPRKCRGTWPGSSRGQGPGPHRLPRSWGPCWCGWDYNGFPAANVKT